MARRDSGFVGDPWLRISSVPLSKDSNAVLQQDSSWHSLPRRWAVFGMMFSCGAEEQYLPFITLPVRSMGPGRFPGRMRPAGSDICFVTYAVVTKAKEKIAASRGALGPVTLASSYSS